MAETGISESMGWSLVVATGMMFHGILTPS